MPTQLQYAVGMSPDGTKNITVAHPPGATKSKNWPKVCVILCDQNKPGFPNPIPDPLPVPNPLPDPRPEYYVDHMDDIPVTNSHWSHTFSGVPSGKYTIVAIKKDVQKHVDERDHVSDVQVP